MEDAAAARTAGWLDRIAALSPEQAAALARSLRAHRAGGDPAAIDPAAIDPAGGYTAAGDPDGGRASSRLVAYVVPREPAAVSAAQLREFLAQRLPPALIPVAFQMLPALPLLPSGKLDRRGLPALPLAAGRAHLSQAYAAPRGPVEEQICRMLTEVLGVPDVGIHDEFWELGGDSLTAIRLIHRIRQAFGVDLAAARLFDEPTAAMLATAVADASAAAAVREQVPLVAAPRDGPPPLSSAQLRHWFLQMVDPGSPAYNICDTLRLTGPLDAGALERALGAVIERHEILRTCYPTVDGQPEPDIAPPGSFSLPVADLRAMPGPAGEQVAGDLIAKDRGQPFDLGRLPLLRARLIRLTDDESLFSVVAHHIVADDWALNVLYGELSALYGASLDGRPSPLPALPVQYADYAVWERRMLAYRLGAGLDYWRERLATAPAAPLLPAPAGQSQVGWHRFAIPDELTGRLANWCQHRSVTMFVACLAAFASVLGRRAGQDEVVVGVPFANRERLELEQMIGCFINPAAVRIDLSGAPGPSELVDRVDRAVRPCYAMQYVPYEKVTDAVRTARAQAGRPGTGAPLFDVVLNFVPEPAALRLGDVRAEIVDDLPPSQPAKNGLTLYLERTDRALLGRMAYETGRLTEESVAGLAAGFLATIEGLCR